MIILYCCFCKNYFFQKISVALYFLFGLFSLYLASVSQLSLSTDLHKIWPECVLLCTIYTSSRAIFQKLKNTPQWQNIKIKVFTTHLFRLLQKIFLTNLKTVQFLSIIAMTGSLSGRFVV